MPGWLLSLLGIVVPSVITLPLHLAGAIAIRRAAARPRSFAADDVSWRTAITRVPFGWVDPRSGIAARAPRRLSQRLDGADPRSLASSYRQRFFLHVAVAEAPALLGFAVCIVLLEPWMYLVGALFAAVGFWRLAPTGPHLARDQDALTVSGCPWVLAEVLADG